MKKILALMISLAIVMSFVVLPVRAADYAITTLDTTAFTQVNTASGWTEVTGISNLNTDANAWQKTTPVYDVTDFVMTFDVAFPEAMNEIGTYVARGLRIAFGAVESPEAGYTLVLNPAHSTKSIVVRDDFNESAALTDGYYITDSAYNFGKTDAGNGQYNIPNKKVYVERQGEALKFAIYNGEGTIEFAGSSILTAANAGNQVFIQGLECKTNVTNIHLWKKKVAPTPGPVNHVIDITDYGFVPEDTSEGYTKVEGVTGWSEDNTFGTNYALVENVGDFVMEFKLDIPDINDVSGYDYHMNIHTGKEYITLIPHWTGDNTTIMCAENDTSYSTLYTTGIKASTYNFGRITTGGPYPTPETSTFEPKKVRVEKTGDELLLAVYGYESNGGNNRGALEFVGRITAVANTGVETIGFGQYNLNVPVTELEIWKEGEAQVPATTPAITGNTNAVANNDNGYVWKLTLSDYSADYTYGLTFKDTSTEETKTATIDFGNSVIEGSCEFDVALQLMSARTIELITSVTAK